MKHYIGLNQMTVIRIRSATRTTAVVAFIARPYQIRYSFKTPYGSNGTNASQSWWVGR